MRQQAERESMDLFVRGQQLKVADLSPHTQLLSWGFALYHIYLSVCLSIYLSIYPSSIYHLSSIY